MIQDRTTIRRFLAAAAIMACSLIGSVLRAGEPVSLDGLRDGIAHWKNGHDADGYPAYKRQQVAEIADNLLLYQRANGGWPKDFDPTRVLSEDEKGELGRNRQRDDTTFDNRATYTVVEYLAHAYAGTRDERYRAAALGGLEFILKAQYPHGGWPHSYPSTKGYYPHVTIVDDVMSGILTTLRRCAGGQAPYEFIEAPLRARIAGAVERGDACLLRLQIVVDGRLTVWAAQYDSQTLEPAQGRSYELPALISSESVGVVRYLMAIEQPTPEVRRAVDAAVAWFDRSKITGLRVARVPAETVRYRNHTSRDDRVAIEDPSAPPIWARFYEIETDRPFMANRDGGKVFRLADVERERRTGYAWYSGAPARLFERDYPAWRKKWAAQ